jgi:hypothetical protein
MICRVPPCRLRIAVPAVLITLSAALPAAAQTIVGEVVESGARGPVQGAFIRLHDADGVQRAAALSDSAGRFTLRAPQPGTYTLQAERIGHAITRSEPLELTSGPALRYTLVVPVQAIALDRLPVVARNRCRVRPESGAETQRLWDEARKVLGVVDWSVNQGGFGFEIATFRHELDRQGRPLRTARPETGSIFGRRPFTTLSPQALAERGFIQPARDENFTFYAPDAEVLLSDVFQSTHCFWVVRGHGRQHAGMVGLAFEPLRTTRLPDINGVLWMDERTSELRRLEYRYTSLPWGLNDGMASGEIEFGRTPAGAWIMQRWSIRIPRVQHAPHMRGVPPDRQYQHIGFEEAGGEVRGLRGGGVARPHADAVFASMLRP